MKYNIKIFEKENFGCVRIFINENGEPLFCARDVAESLGYSDTNDATSRHCKSGKKVFHPHANGIGGAHYIYIPEKDVYRLIMRSNLPNAEKFQDWICDEVLPEIRKTGGYNQAWNYKVAYPYRKQINRLERLKALSCDQIEIMQKWILNIQEERDIYLQQTQACIGTVCTRNFSESENMHQLGDLFRSIRIKRNISPSSLYSVAGIKLATTTLTDFEKGKADISLSHFLKLLSALDCSIQIIKNED